MGDNVGGRLFPFWTDEGMEKLWIDLNLNKKWGVKHHRKNKNRNKKHKQTHNCCLFFASRKWWMVAAFNCSLCGMKEGEWHGRWIAIQSKNTGQEILVMMKNQTKSTNNLTVAAFSLLVASDGQ